MPEEEKKIDVKEAVVLAKKYLYELKGIRTDESNLEEIEMSKDKPCWLITLSYPSADYSSVLIMTPRKIYKIFEVDINTGQILSMKIRQI